MGGPISAADSRFAQLPVQQVIPALRQALSEQDRVILQAAAGAGKTTAVPLQLLDSPWLAGKRIVMLEPRRVAARAAAEQMARLLGEPVGQTVGYRMRMDSKVSAATRIEVITEGVFTRRVQQDPSLAEIGLLIFDECHERHLDTDLGLALALFCQREFRSADSPLKVLLMSATLAAERLATRLQAPVIESQARQFPVSIRYHGPAPAPRDRLSVLKQAVLSQLAEHPHSALLVFLSGQAEIQQLAKALATGVDQRVMICPLYAALPISAQRQAIEPAPAGRQKVVLATNVAESSVTLSGVDVVIDTGLEKCARFEPSSGLTRLQTQSISRASADQRAGRAGRQGPGVCLRLYDAASYQSWPLERPAAIESADLAPLLLQLLAIGVEPDELFWLDPPSPARLSQAKDLLGQLGAFRTWPSESVALSPLGEQLAQWPLHPRLSAMLLRASALGLGEEALALAAVLSDPPPSAEANEDLALLVEPILAGHSATPWAKRVQQWLRRLRRQLPPTPPEAVALSPRDRGELTPLGLCVALAYPDRLAMPLGQGRYRLSQGRQVQLHPKARPWPKDQWLAVAEVRSAQGVAVDYIGSAVALSSEYFSSVLADWLVEEREVRWSMTDQRLIALQHQRLGANRWRSVPLKQVEVAERQQAILAMLGQQGLAFLPLSEGFFRYRARVQWAASLKLNGLDWPCWEDQALVDSAPLWLAEAVSSVRDQRDLAAIDYLGLLQARLDWPMQQALQQHLPESIAVPSGRLALIDYQQDPPVLAIKLQEMFGCAQTPTVAQGRLPLVLHLLSPAKQPLQVTQDLAHFWANSYQEVKKQMRGRYPKHPWPDDPLSAQASALTKRALQRGQAPRA